MGIIHGTFSFDQYQVAIEDNLPAFYKHWGSLSFLQTTTTILLTFDFPELGHVWTDALDLAQKTWEMDRGHEIRFQLERSGEEQSFTLASLRHRLLSFLTNLCLRYPYHHNDSILSVWMNGNGNMSGARFEDEEGGTVTINTDGKHEE